MVLAELEQAGIMSRSGPPEFRTNFGKTLRMNPTLWARPRNLAELQRVVAFASQQRLSVKPVGSLCTWSPAARPDDTGIALLTDRLDQITEPDFEVLRPAHRVAGPDGRAPLLTSEIVRLRVAVVPGRPE